MHQFKRSGQYSPCLMYVSRLIKKNGLKSKAKSQKKKKPNNNKQTKRQTKRDIAVKRKVSGDRKTGEESGIQLGSRFFLSSQWCLPIPTTAHVVIALGKQFTYISSVHPSAKWVPGYRQLKCIDY